MERTVNPTSVRQGSTFTLTYQIRNAGSAVASNFTTRFYFNTDALISTADTYLDHERTLTLAAAATSTAYDVTVRLPDDASLGTRYIGGLADYNTLITESNELNNTRSAAMTVTAGSITRIADLRHSDPRFFEIHFTGRVGREYILEETTKLPGTWSDVDSQFICKPGTNIVLRLENSPGMFRRLRLIP